MKKYFFNFFCLNHPPTRYLKHNVIYFVPSNESIMENKLPSTSFATISKTD